MGIARRGLLFVGVLALCDLVAATFLERFERVSRSPDATDVAAPR